VIAAGWPFLVGRSRNAGYRVIIAPEFMAGSRQDVAAIGWLATGAETDTTEAFVKELRGPAEAPATAVFRNFPAHAHDYLPGGSGLLKDSSGRPIIITEGLILRLTGTQTTELGLTTADLSRAHELVKPTFREFWQQEDKYPQQQSQSFPVGQVTSGAVPLTLRNAQPSSAQAPRQASPPIASRPRAPAKAMRPTRPKWRLILGVVAAAAAACLAAIGIYGLVFAPRPVSSEQAQFLRAFCRDLVAGETSTAYALTTPAFDTTTTEKAFTAALLNGHTQARSCTPANPSNTSTSATAITVATGSGTPKTWDLTLVMRDGKLKINRLQEAGNP
jgi:hypothetical protein